MEVGVGLNLSRETIESISQEKKDNTERNITILSTWKRRNSCSASFIKLVKAFLKIKKQLVAESKISFKENNISISSSDLQASSRDGKRSLSKMG